MTDVNAPAAPSTPLQAETVAVNLDVAGSEVLRRVAEMAGVTVSQAAAVTLAWGIFRELDRIERHGAEALREKAAKAAEGKGDGTE
jgi:hypothetical protein